MEDYDNKETSAEIDVDDKMPTTFSTSTKKKRFANPTAAKTEKEEMWDAVFDIAETYKEQYKSASKKDKALILAIILPLVLLLAIGAAGVFLANMGQALQVRELEIIGFVCMGVGLGGFFLFIIGLLIWNKFR